MPDSKESLQEEGRVGEEGQNNMGSLFEFNKRRRFHISVYFFSSSVFVIDRSHS